MVTLGKPSDLCVRNIQKREETVARRSNCSGFKRLLGQFRVPGTQDPLPKAGRVRAGEQILQVILNPLENPDDNQVFLDLIRDKLTLDLYNVNEMIEDVLEVCYDDPDNFILNKASLLYTNCNRHRGHVLYLKLGDKTVFTGP